MLVCLGVAALRMSRMTIELLGGVAVMIALGCIFLELQVLPGRRQRRLAFPQLLLRRNDDAASMVTPATTLVVFSFAFLWRISLMRLLSGVCAALYTGENGKALVRSSF